MRRVDRTLELLVGQDEEGLERPPGLALVVEEGHRIEIHVAMVGPRKAWRGHPFR